MKKLFLNLVMIVAFLMFACSAIAYSIRDDIIGGDCTLIGSWDATTKKCTITTDLNNLISGIIIDSDGITLDGNRHTISGGLNANVGLIINNKRGVRIENVILYLYNIGISIENSSYVFIVNNEIYNSEAYGLYFYNSSNNTVSGNKVVETAYKGIFLGNASSNNIVVNNTISNRDLISGVSNNGFVIYKNSDFNRIVNNSVYASNAYAYLFRIMDYSDENVIYNNNFFGAQDTYVQIVCCDSTGNKFDLNIPSGGNYWSYFDTLAEGCADANNDGFCDSTFYFEGVVDNLPWITQNGFWADTDNDGFSSIIDCNDSSSNINPIALEIAYNGLDENCNGIDDDDDIDNDNFGIANDCDDYDVTIYPDAAEIKYDSVDQDCNGYDLTIDIITASYSTRNDSLIVEATSSLSGAANLSLADYGPMTWKLSQNKWTITVKSAGGNPGIVTVLGIEGLETANVLIK